MAVFLGPRSERRVDNPQEPAGVGELRDVFHSTRLYTVHTAMISYEAIGQTLNYIRELEFQLIKAKKDLAEEKFAFQYYKDSGYMPNA